MVRISKEETTTIVTIGLGGTPPIITRISLHDQTFHMGIIAQTMGDRLINAQISHLIEAMETDLAMNLSTIRMETGGTMETSLVLRRLKGETSHKIIPIANQEVINLITLLSADLTINRPMTSFAPYEQKFPHNKNQISSYVVRFITTDDIINELSDLCPLNY